MQPPQVPEDEEARLMSLRGLNILDTLPEERFDRLTRLAKRLFGVPIALVSLVDENRQWFKSCLGLDVSETARELSFCGHAILGDDVFLIPDARLDDRFSDNPLVLGKPQIRFYAGCPLTMPNGTRLGTLCIIDQEPRQFGDDEVNALRDLASLAEQELAALQLATMDDLTGVSNRRGFETLCTHALELCRRLDRPASVLYFDLDGFKQINDRFGHAEGDRALIQFVQLLKETFRDSDVLGRLGGDEFAVLLTDAAVVGVDTVLQRIRAAVERHNRASEDYALDYSVGAVRFDVARHADFCALLSEADAQMYEEKNTRRRRVDGGGRQPAAG